MSVHKWCKVLIVDDELLIRKGIKHSINWEKEGFQIIGEATNGEEALDLIETFRPHIVISDMVMPVMDGVELTKAIKEDYPQIEIIILSSFGDFNYVRSTFQLGISDYILKPQLEGADLLKTLKQAAYKIPGVVLVDNSGGDVTVSIENIIDRVMTGFGLDEDPGLIGNIFTHSHFCLLGIDIRAHTNHKKSMIRPLIEEIEERVKSDFTHIEIHRLPVNLNIMAFMFNFELNQLHSIKEFIKMLSMSLTFVDTKVGWALTEPFIDFLELKQVYQEKLLPLIQYHFYLPDTLLMIYDEIPSVRQVNEPFQLTKFTKLFQRQQFEAAFLYLEAYIEDLAHQYTTDEFSFKSLVGNIIFNVTILFGNMENNSRSLEEEKYSYISSIEGALNVKEALSLLDEFLTKAKAAIELTLTNPNQNNMKKLLDYINENYAESLNLTDMGKKFHYNPSYLSNYFSENNNQSFSEYLKQVRIEKSIELLQKEEVSIAKISMLVGYSDHSYFCRVFKSSIGVSPSSYRRQYSSTKKRGK
ncbi:response regulator transcription factor [Sporosarcina sp. ANT_H38]|uniref:response regulator transcription factor n=1 Tax=Sporosarcina sp. ANT_H38 TaxID=2597358 RepID=UPI0011F3BD7A|nr:response regulator transcription factor [Sporosarcina sp. ANT_H38]KAA0965596.1 response regulator transcription factor [Sporosarcina sp. ANT_H38]